MVSITRHEKRPEIVWLLKIKSNHSLFVWTALTQSCHYTVLDEVGSSSCRVTGVSSLNLARGAVQRPGHFFDSQSWKSCHHIFFRFWQFFERLFQNLMLRRKIIARGRD
jgi:hypothetical protein